jgi:hypothetical protein
MTIEPGVSMNIIRLPLFLILCLETFGCHNVEQTTPPEIRDSDAFFNGITLNMTESQVNLVLRTGGEKLRIPNWPSRLGDIPGYKKGAIVVGPEERIEWVVWKDVKKHNWIAVGFVNLQGGGVLSVPTAVIRKSGLLEPFPE